MHLLKAGGWETSASFVSVLMRHRYLFFYIENLYGFFLITLNAIVYTGNTQSANHLNNQKKKENRSVDGLQLFCDTLIQFHQNVSQL